LLHWCMRCWCERVGVGLLPPNCFHPPPPPHHRGGNGGGRQVRVHVHGSSHSWCMVVGGAGGRRACGREPVCSGNEQLVSVFRHQD
jgi:hypothetical protein